MEGRRLESSHVVSCDLATKHWQVTGSVCVAAHLGMLTRLPMSGEMSVLSHPHTRLGLGILAFNFAVQGCADGDKALPGSRRRLRAVQRLEPASRGAGFFFPEIVMELLAGLDSLASFHLENRQAAAICQPKKWAQFRT